MQASSRTLALCCFAVLLALILGFGAAPASADDNWVELVARDGTRIVGIHRPSSDGSIVIIDADGIEHSFEFSDVLSMATTKPPPVEPVFDPRRLIGRWRLVYQDRELGQVSGWVRVDALDPRSPGSTLSAQAQLVHPVTGEEYRMTGYQVEVAEGRVRFRFVGRSPSAAKPVAADASARSALSIPVPLGVLLTASVDHGDAVARIAAGDSSPRELFVSFALPAGHDPPDRLDGEWSYPLENPSAATPAGQRAGNYDSQAGRVSGSETWIRSALRIDQVEALDRQSYTQLVAAGAAPDPASAELHAEFGEQALARVWLRLYGTDLPLPGAPAPVVVFNDANLEYTGEYRPFGTNGTAIDVRVLLLRGFLPGPKRFTFNQAGAVWDASDDTLVDGVSFVRLDASSGGDGRFEPVGTLYAGEAPRIEVHFADQPLFEHFPLMLWSIPVTTAGADIDAAKPLGLAVAKPRLEAPDGPWYTDPIELRAAGSGGTKPPATGAAAVELPLNSMVAAVALSDPRGKAALAEFVLPPEPSLWQQAVERATRCHDEHGGVYVFDESIWMPAVMEGLVLWPATPLLVVGGAIEPEHLEIRVGVDLHAALLLMHDELATQLQREIDDNQRKRAGDRNTSSDQTERAARLVEVRVLQRFALQGGDDPLLRIEVATIDGRDRLPLGDALHPGTAAGPLDDNYLLRALAEARIILYERMRQAAERTHRIDDCDPEALLRLVAPGAQVLRDRLLPRLVRPRRGLEPPNPAVVPDEAAAHMVRAAVHLSEAYVAQSEAGELDNLGLLILATGPVALAGGAGAAVLGVLDAATVGEHLRSAWERVDEVDFATGTMPVLGTQVLDAAEAAVMREYISAAAVPISHGVFRAAGYGASRVVGAVGQSRRAIEAVERYLAEGEGALSATDRQLVKLYRGYARRRGAQLGDDLSELGALERRVLERDGASMGSAGNTPPAAPDTQAPPDYSPFNVAEGPQAGIETVDVPPSAARPTDTSDVTEAVPVAFRNIENIRVKDRHRLLERWDELMAGEPQSVQEAAADLLEQYHRHAAAAGIDDVHPVVELDQAHRQATRIAKGAITRNEALVEGVLLLNGGNVQLERLAGALGTSEADARALVQRVADEMGQIVEEVPARAASMSAPATQIPLPPFVDEMMGRITDTRVKTYCGALGRQIARLKPSEQAVIHRMTEVFADQDMPPERALDLAWLWSADGVEEGVVRGLLQIGDLDAAALARSLGRSPAEVDVLIMQVADWHGISPEQVRRALANGRK